jgi:uncharacterized protein (DUF305 family)
VTSMYRRLAASLGASLVAMYFLAFSQIDVIDHFKWSLSVFWISVSMVSGMAMIMLAAMWSMLGNTRLKIILVVVFAVVLVGAFAAGRSEALVGDDAFLGSMIPHHSRAIHMCQEAGLTDPAIIELCDGIIRTQRQEIAEMERIIERRS